MSENQWQSPGGEPMPPQPPPGGHQPAMAPTPAAPGWTPPPKPGLIPLRPLDLGVILGASFRALRRNPGPTFGVALVIQSVITLVSLGIVGGVTYYTSTRLDFSSTENQSTITAGNIGLLVLSVLVALVLTLVGSALLQGIIVLEISRATLGEKQRLSQIWRRARGRIGALIGWTAIVAVVAAVAIAIIAGLITLLVVTLGVAGIIAGVLLGLFGGLGLLVLYFWLTTKLAFVPGALMLERLTIRQAIARSWSLTRGYFWRTLGIMLLVLVMLQVASSVISTPLTFVAQFAQPLIDPNKKSGATTIVLVAVVGVLALIITLVFSAITAVVQTATTALLYLDTRIRKEGLDIDLAHFVESRRSGAAPARDPYLRAEASPTA